jgi:hypothetical protein
MHCASYINWSSLCIDAGACVKLFYSLALHAGPVPSFRFPKSVLILVAYLLLNIKKNKSPIFKLFIYLLLLLFLKCKINDILCFSMNYIKIK